MMLTQKKKEQEKRKKKKAHFSRASAAKKVFVINDGEVHGLRAGGSSNSPTVGRKIMKSTYLIHKHKSTFP